MMQREFIFYISFMLAGLTAAYWAAIPDTGSEHGQVVVFEGQAESIQTISYGDADYQIEARRQPDGYFWIERSKIVDGEGDHPKQLVESFVANEKFDDLLNYLAPLTVGRVIEDVSPDERQEFGLEDPKERVSVSSGSQKPFVLRFGRKSYGSANRFAEIGSTGKVILVDSRPFEDLKRANLRLYQRKIAGESFAKATRVTIDYGDNRSVTMIRDPDVAGSDSNWGMAGADGQFIKAPRYDTIMDKIEKLRVIRYVGGSTNEKLINTSPTWRVTLHDGAEALRELSFKTIEGGDTKESNTFVATNRSKRYALMPKGRIDALAKDLEDLFANHSSSQD